MTARWWTGDDDRDDLAPDYDADTCADCGARWDEPCEDDCRCASCARARALALVQRACWDDLLHLMLRRGWPFTKAAYLVAATLPDTPDFPLDAELRTSIPDELEGELPESTAEYYRVRFSLPRPEPPASSATSDSTIDPSRSPLPQVPDEQWVPPDAQQIHDQAHEDAAYDAYWAQQPPPSEDPTLTLSDVLHWYEQYLARTQHTHGTAVAPQGREMTMKITPRLLELLAQPVNPLSAQELHDEELVKMKRRTPPQARKDKALVEELLRQKGHTGSCSHSDEEHSDNSYGQPHDSQPERSAGHRDSSAINR